MTWTITDTSYLVCILYIQSSFEWCQWLSDLEVDLYYMLYMSPYDLMLHEERDQCFTCILTKRGGGLNLEIVNTLKFKIESHFLTISSLILRMVHFLPPVLVLVQLLLIICHVLVPRHDAMETLYPGPFCQNLVITCISIETRALPKVKEYMTNGTVLELISFLGRTADIVTILKHLNPHFKASKEQSIRTLLSNKYM